MLMSMYELSTVSVLFITFVLSVLIFYLIGSGKRKHYPNGPIGVPVLGHLPFLGKYPPNTFLRWKQRYGDVFRIRMGSWETVVVNGYRAIKEASEKPDDAFSGRPEFITFKLLKDIHGETSLAFGPFDETYLQHRKISSTVLRTFTNDRKELTEDLILEEADALIDKLMKKARNGPVDIRPDLQYATGSVIYQLLYGRGLDLSEQIDTMIENARKFLKFSGSGNPCDVIPWLRYVMPWKITGFVDMISQEDVVRHGRIEDHIKSFSPDHIRDITDAFLEADQRMQEGNIRREPGLTRSRLLNTTSDLQGAGFDTSNLSLQWLVMYMAMYPEVQQRVRMEIDDVIGSAHRIELKHKSSLIYTEATILEVMRISILVPFGLPKCTIKDTTLDGYDIDKGTVVFFNLHSVSFEKDFWGDPQNFRPDRLIDDNNTLNKEMCSHVSPFGFGRRRCAGEFLARMEMFLLFSNLIRKCEFLKPANEDYDMEPLPGLAYSPKPFRVVIKERQ